MADSDEARLVLIKRGLREAAEMIDGLKATNAKALRARLSALTEKVEAWTTRPPSRIERASMVNSVLELNLDALKLRRESK